MSPTWVNVERILTVTCMAMYYVTDYKKYAKSLENTFHIDQVASQFMHHSFRFNFNDTTLTKELMNLLNFNSLELEVDNTFTSRLK